MYKQAIVVRKDLDMGKGKMAAQVAHASIGSMKAAAKALVDEWEDSGSKKVVLKVDCIKQLNSIKNAAKKAGLPYFLVRDAGLTQTDPGTATCLGIGPDEDEKIDAVTSGLKLL